MNARTELAIRYNDISPLENHHCAVAFDIISQVGVISLSLSVITTARLENGYMLFVQGGKVIVLHVRHALCRPVAGAARGPPTPKKKNFRLCNSELCKGTKSYFCSAKNDQEL